LKIFPKLQYKNNKKCSSFIPNLLYSHWK